jgi:uncharacterized protein
MAQKFLTAFLIVGFYALPSWSWQPPAFSSNVYDAAGILSVAEVQKLHDSIQKLRDSDDVWAAVAIIPTLEQETIEQAAHKTFEEWQLGEKRKDNGLLIFVALNEHKMRIEVGNGLQGSVTDLTSHRIIEEILQPHFRQKDFAGGIELALEKIGKIHHGELDEDVVKTKPNPEPFSWAWATVGFLFSFLCPYLFFIYFFWKRAHGTRVRFRQLPSGLLMSIVSCTLIGLFMSLFWGSGAHMPNFLIFFPLFQLFFIVPCSIPILECVRFLRSDGRLRVSNLEWDEAEAALSKYNKSLASARAQGSDKEKEFIYRNRVPVYPGQRSRPSPEDVFKEKQVWAQARHIAGWRRFFGSLQRSGAVVYFWQFSMGSGSGSDSSSGSTSSSSSSSSSSSDSSSSSSSSSSGGGSSDGGGASGSW